MLDNRFIKKLQDAPEHLKRAVMWAGIFVIMALILAFWIWSFNFSAGDGAAAAVPAMPGVLDSLKTQAGLIRDLFK